jgi:hypothetical protein
MYLHVCSKIFETKNFCKCSLNHNLNTEFNKKILDKRGLLDIDTKILKLYFQVNLIIFQIVLNQL